MKFCSRCGKEIFDEAIVCPHCGVSAKNQVEADDAPNPLFNVLSFFIPIVGLILYLVYEKRFPQKDKSAGKWALIGLCAEIAVSIVFSVIFGILLSSLLMF